MRSAHVPCVRRVPAALGVMLGVALTLAAGCSQVADVMRGAARAIAPRMQEEARQAMVDKGMPEQQATELAQAFADAWTEALDKAAAQQPQTDWTPFLETVGLIAVGMLGGTGATVAGRRVLKKK